MNVWKIPKFQWNLSVRYQNIPPHTWTYPSSRVLVKFILMFHQNIAANVWMYEKFQNSSEIYPYIIKIFQLIVLFQWQKWNFISQSAIYIWYVLETWDMVIIWAKNLPVWCNCKLIFDQTNLDNCHLFVWLVLLPLNLPKGNHSTWK